MRKTQVALAALALVASTAALADGATLYGTLDASVTKATGATTTFTGSGQWGANVIGVRGSQDLDGGMKVTYNLEAGINSANGSRDNGGPNGIGALNASTATNTTDTIGVNGLFNRAANVGLVTAGGTITAGLQVTPFIATATSNLGLVGNNFVVPYLVNAGAADGGGTAASATGGFFQPDAISYSNASGPLSFSVMTSTGDKAATAMNRYSGASINYAISEDTNVYAAFANRTHAYSNWVAGIKHKMGDLTLAAQYIDTGLKTNANIAGVNASGTADGSQQASDGSTYVLSAAYALGGGNTVGVNYSTTEYSVAPNSGSYAANVNNNLNARNILNVSFQHALSKSTSIYAFAASTDNAALSTYVTTGKNAFGVGINTNF
jgi:predicted porin